LQLNSVGFFLFFVAVTTIYFILPHKFRCLHLLLSSYLFYISWNLNYAILLLSLTLLTYVSAIVMANTCSGRRKQYLFIGTLLLNIAPLLMLKYGNFIIKSLHSLLDSAGLRTQAPALNVILPVGVSFYCFKTISYTIDVYRGTIIPEVHFDKYALYVSFFPSLLAGPIDRAAMLIPQFYKRVHCDLLRIFEGLELMIWGVFKKAVIADCLAIYVDNIYNNLPYANGPSCLLAIYLYGFQIYCDFSGYSDIAIGAAKILGFDLMENFDLPYFSRTIAEFWRRWHISLSAWLRDYIYIPMGGNRKGSSGVCFNIMVTMIVCGLWHGSTLTFAIWGGLHGFMLCLTYLVRERERNVGCVSGLFLYTTNLVKFLLTFHLVCLLWVFFRADSLEQALCLIGSLVKGWGSGPVTSGVLIQGVIGVGVILVVQLRERRERVRVSLGRLPLAWQWVGFCLVIFSIILFGVDKGSEFIYFGF
jgi:alginate O-acetyltransferase complex protein AlgI